MEDLIEKFLMLTLHMTVIFLALTLWAGLGIGIYYLIKHVAG